MVKNKNITRNRIGFRNTANANSEALKFIFSLQEVFVSKQSQIFFYKKTNGRFSSKYFPNISFEFKNCNYKGLNGVVFLIYDEVNKTTVTSKFVKRVMEFNTLDDDLVLPFFLEDLNSELGFSNDSVISNNTVYSKYLLIRFRFGNEEIHFKFQCRERDGKVKLYFNTEKYQKNLWKNLTNLDKELIRLRIRSHYKKNWHESINLKESKFCNF